MKAVQPVWNKLLSLEVAESPAHQPQDDEESCGECCVILLLFLAVTGIIFTCVGSGLYVTYNTNERDLKIAEVASVIKAWNKGADATALKNGNFAINITTTGCSNSAASSCPCFNGTYAMQATASPSDMFLDAAQKLPKYQQLRLVFNGTKLGWQYPFNASDDCVMTSEITSGGSQVALLVEPLVPRMVTRIAGAKFACPARLSTELVAKSMEVINCRKACTDVGGYFTAHGITYTCQAPYALKRMCIRVSARQRALGGGFQEENTAGRGCYAPNADVRTSFADEFKTSRLQGPLVQHELVLLGKDAQWGAGVVVEVRSAADPWVEYVRLTEGTLEFQHHLLPQARQGLGLMVVGLLLSLLCCPICFFGWKWLLSRNKYDCPMGMWVTVYDGTHRLTKRIGYDVVGKYMGPGLYNPTFKRGKTEAGFSSCFRQNPCPLEGMEKGHKGELQLTIPGKECDTNYGFATMDTHGKLGGSLQTVVEQKSERE